MSISTIRAALGLHCQKSTHSPKAKRNIAQHLNCAKGQQTSHSSKRTPVVSIVPATGESTVSIPGGRSAQHTGLERTAYEVDIVQNLGGVHPEVNNAASRLKDAISNAVKNGQTLILTGQDILDLKTISPHLGDKAYLAKEVLPLINSLEE